MQPQRWQFLHCPDGSCGEARQGGRAQAVIEACSAAVMKWPHPSCRHPGKERAYLAAEPMTDGSHRQLFSPKGAETPDAETCSLNGGCRQHESREWTDSRRQWCHRKKGLICIGLILSGHWGCTGLLQIFGFFVFILLNTPTELGLDVRLNITQVFLWFSQVTDA